MHPALSAAACHFLPGFLIGGQVAQGSCSVASDNDATFGLQFIPNKKPETTLIWLMRPAAAVDDTNQEQCLLYKVCLPVERHYCQQQLLHSLNQAKIRGLRKLLRPLPA
jgi:hypothetical protein